MANITAGFVQLHPSYTMPEIIMQYQQPSGAFLALPTGSIMPRMSQGDPSCSIDALQISTPTYLRRSRCIYDHHDVAAASNWGFSLPEAQRLAMRQGINQGLRNGLLYGFNPQNTGEGLLNAPGLTATSLPPDSFGNTTVVTYDNGQMAQYLAQQVVAAKIRMNQLGQPARVVILGPQRVIGWNDDSLEFGFDDTLIGKGDGGSDAVLIVIPEIKVPFVGSEPNTNIFATLTPGLQATTLQLTDMAAPREITSPLPDGALATLSEIRATPGWAIRSQGVTKISMIYS